MINDAEISRAVRNKREFGAKRTRGRQRMYNEFMLC